MSASKAISNGPKAPAPRPESAASSSRPAERFTLSGPSALPDPRTHAYRKDVADLDLAGILFAPHYARALVSSVNAATIVRETPSQDGAEVVRLSPGDEFAILDMSGGWAWGYSCAGHLVGYTPLSVFSERI